MKTLQLLFALPARPLMLDKLLRSCMSMNLVPSLVKAFALLQSFLTSKELVIILFRWLRFLDKVDCHMLTVFVVG